MKEAKGAETGFVVLPEGNTSLNEDWEYFNEIQTMCGAALGRINPELMREAHRIFCNKGAGMYEATDMVAEPFLLIMENNYKNLKDRELLERESRLSTLVEAICNQEITNITYGSFAHYYLESLKLQKERRGSGAEYRALLVGAIGKTSVREFQATVKSVFPDSQNAVVDLNGVQTVSAAQDLNLDFMFASAHQLPYKDGYDSIHSSYLMTYVAGRKIMSSADRKAFFLQAYTALRPDGILVMSERKDYADGEFPNRKVKKDLEACGFLDIRIGDAYSIRDRRSTDRFFKGNSIDSASDLPLSKEKSIYIRARK